MLCVSSSSGITRFSLLLILRILPLFLLHWSQTCLCSFDRESSIKLHLRIYRLPLVSLFFIPLSLPFPYILGSMNCFVILCSPIFHNLYRKCICLSYESVHIYLYSHLSLWKPGASSFCLIPRFVELKCLKPIILCLCLDLGCHFILKLF